MARGCATGRTISTGDGYPHIARAGHGRCRGTVERATVWIGGPLRKTHSGIGTNGSSVTAKKKLPVAPELQNGATASNDDRDECVANLLIEGQKLVEANAPDKALECFDMALAIQPKHAEALVKKGGALEKLDRTDEAIACYDRAIEADNSLAIAYLQKGGLFNRLARYDEALQCYEQALRTREKNDAREKVAA